MQYKQGTAIATATEEHVDFNVPRDHTVTAIQIQDEHTYPLYVRVEYYPDLSEEFPIILFCNWLRSNSTYYNNPAIALNFPIDNEKGIIRVNMLNQTGATVTPVINLIYHYKTTAYVSHYNVEEHRGVWAYDAMIERHTSAGALEFDIVPQPGSWFELESMLITAGFSGAEDLVVSIQDSAGGVINTLMSDSTTTGTFEIPIRKRMEEDNTALTEASIGAVQQIVRITYPDRLNVTTSSVPATDDVLVRIRANLKDQIPAIDYTGNTQAQAGYAATAYSIVI